MILTLKNKEVTRELVGNKGFNLWTMKNELDMNVPPCLFLTTEYSKISLLDGKLPEQTNLLQLFLAFEGKEVAIRSSGTQSMPGMLDTFFLAKDHTSDDMFDAIRKVIESWNSKKAEQYRTICEIPHEPDIAVVIQEKVATDQLNGYAGICFTRDTVTGQRGLNGEFLKSELGDELASGRKTGISISELPSEILKELEAMCEKLEKFYRRPQDVEWGYADNQLYLLQTRTAKLSSNAIGKIYLDLWDEGIITDFKELDDCIDYRLTVGATLYRVSKYEKNEVIKLTTGTTASPGFCQGHVVFLDSTRSFGGRGGGNILFAEMTSTDDLKQIDDACGLVTINGGYTSHPAIVARELKKPCIVATKNIKFLDDKRIQIGDEVFEEGDCVTLSADTGELYKGTLESEEYHDYDDRLYKLREEYRNKKVD